MSTARVEAPEAPKSSSTPEQSPPTTAATAPGPGSCFTCEYLTFTADPPELPKNAATIDGKSLAMGLSVDNADPLKTAQSTGAAPTTAERAEAPVVGPLDVDDVP